MRGIARDRASVFAEAVRQGTPEASEVSDRWHLLRNLDDALRAAVDRHRPPVAIFLDPFRADLERRWREGCHNAVEPWPEIKARGFAGSLKTVRRWAEPRPGPQRPDAIAAAPRTAPSRLPSRRRCAWLPGLEPGKLKPGEQAFITRLTAVAPKLAEASSPARRFAAMIRARDGTDLDAWLASARESELGPLAQNLARDLTAARAAITEPWSTSPVEGQISGLKAIKRQMFGRAGHELLHHRVLAAA